MTHCGNPGEEKRLAALERLKILDTPGEQAYDEIVSLVQATLRVPMALVTLVDRDRQWFKARVGVGGSESPLDVSFCSRAIASDNLCEPFVVEDASRDARFKDMSVVTGPPFVRMYVGMPLVTRSGYAVGTLCAADHVARKLSATEINAMKTLGRSVCNLLALREGY